MRTMNNTKTAFGFQVYGDETCFWFATHAEAAYLRGVLMAGGKECSTVRASGVL